MNGLIKAGVDALEIMFAAGVIGSVLVLILSGIEDLHTLARSGEREN